MVTIKVNTCPVYRCKCKYAADLQLMVAKRKHRGLLMVEYVKCKNYCKEAKITNWVTV